MVEGEGLQEATVLLPLRMHQGEDLPAVGDQTVVGEALTLLC